MGLLAYSLGKKDFGSVFRLLQMVGMEIFLGVVQCQACYTLRVLREIVQYNVYSGLIMAHCLMAHHNFPH